mgnify:CR=1 FL=1
MTGLLALIILGLFLFIVWKITGFIYKLLNDRFKFKTSHKGWVKPLVFVGVLILVFSDEIVGYFQFKSICNKATDKGVVMSEKISTLKPDSKTVLYRSFSRESPLAGRFPIEIAKRGINRMTASGDVLIYEPYYYAKRGWLKRALALDGSAPLLFRGKCGIKPDRSILLKEHGIIFSNKSYSQYEQDK